MLKSELVHFFFYILAIAMPLVLGLFAMLMSRGRIARTFSTLLFQQAIWSAAVLCEVFAKGLNAKIFWDDFQFFISGTVALTALSFALQNEGRWFKTKWKTYTVAISYIAAAWLFAVTDRWHHLLRLNIRLDSSLPFGELVYTFSLPAIFILMPIYAMAIVATYRLSALAVHRRGSIRVGAALACIGLALPLLGTVVTIIGVRIIRRLDMSSIWLVLGDIFLAVGILRFRLANIVPTARTAIFKSIRDPVLVIDGKGAILESNVPLNAIPGVACRKLPSGDAARCFSRWPEEAVSVISGERREAEVIINLDPAAEPESLSANDTPNSSLHFLVKNYPLRRNLGGRIVLIRNISTLRHAEAELKNLSLLLEDKVAERTASLEQEIFQRSRAETLLGELNAELGKTQKEIMVTLSEVVENRSMETAHHVTRVSEYARVIGMALGMSGWEAENLANASAMHDIGKIGIPDALLSKRGPLDQEETVLIRTHTLIGAEILHNSKQELIQAAALIALQHHERWDGTGYPAGLSGTGISLPARIVAVCDVFDSLASDRCYRQGWEMDDILQFFQEEKAKIFDPEIVDALFSVLDLLLEINRQYPDVSNATGAAVQAGAQ